MVVKSTSRFEGIDILRGFAAMVVVLSHYSSHCVRYFGNAPFQVDLVYGYYAVQLFFMISGFVIYFTVERSQSWRDFAISRMTRLYPAYWAALTVVVAAEVLLFGGQMWWRGYLANLTMLQEFVGIQNHDNVFWSLTVELAFYAVIGVILRLGLLQHIGVIAAAWLIVDGLLFVLFRSVSMPMPTVMTRYLLMLYAPFFLLGIMLYLLQMRGSNQLHILVVILAMGTVLLLHGLENMLITVLLFAFLALAIAGKLRFLVSPITLWLGTISYSLYLVHRNLGYLVIDAMHSQGVPIEIILPITITGSLILASLLTYVIERPICAYLRTAYLAFRNSRPGASEAVSIR